MFNHPTPQSPRRGSIMIEVLVSVVLLGITLAMFGQATESLQNLMAATQPLDDQMIIPRQIVEYWRRTPYYNLPAESQAFLFDSVDVVATRVAGTVSTRIPRFSTVFTDTRPAATVTPDTLEFDMNPYLAWPGVTNGFNIGDHRP